MLDLRSAALARSEVVRCQPGAAQSVPPKVNRDNDDRQKSEILGIIDATTRSIREPLVCDRRQQLPQGILANVIDELRARDYARGFRARKVYDRGRKRRGQRVRIDLTRRNENTRQRRNRLLQERWRDFVRSRDPAIIGKYGAMPTRPEAANVAGRLGGPTSQSKPPLHADRGRIACGDSNRGTNDATTKHGRR